MSQKEVARILGVSVCTVRSVERGALRKLRRQTAQLREIQGLLASRHDGLWIRPYRTLTVDVFCRRGT